MSLPPDDYIGEPGYPAPWTTSQPREALRDTDEARVICLAPDICRAPKAPVPFMIYDTFGHDEDYTPSVRFTGQKAMVLRSHTTHVHGDEPGVGKGVVSGTVGGICEPIGHAAQVRAEGSPVIRHLDRFWMNNRNTVGEAIFVRDTATYAPPEDDDPLPGSMQLAATGASSSYFLAPSPPVQAPPATAPAPPPSGPAPGPSVPGGAPNRLPSVGPLLRRIGVLGWILHGYDLGQRENQRAWDDPEGYMAREAERYGGVDSFNDTQREIHDRAIERLRNGGRQGHVRGDYDQEMDRERAERARAESLAQPQTQTDTDTGTRVDEDEDNQRCPYIVICFSPTTTNYDPVEFQRQLSEQETALQVMSPSSYTRNRSRILADGTTDIARSSPRARRAYRQIWAEYRSDKGPPPGDGSLAALHALDIVAGGDPANYLRIGPQRENRIIGAQWAQWRGVQGGDRLQRLDAHAVRLEQNGCPQMTARLRVCPGRGVDAEGNPL
ncbi:PAAR-like domain-containing protein [Roseinatronobacter alkalisoli]|uniref:DUF4150 domain-containing protein n=1 Tax=Roseinatronobacter alkalisoli TaxID=3028235 RepID=A0ABT5TFJ8_9RHOB|nr:PAAR-like domain-containing protein [Roseinatronobacter sp. HJB301]MDD7973901.1 DUF4150 domain-containing protein [Roseinatronobacter sp. HJB301]